MTVYTPEDVECILYNTARYLAEGKQDDALKTLLSCSISIEGKGIVDMERTYDTSVRVYMYEVTLVGPRASYDLLNEYSNDQTWAIREALKIVLHAQREFFRDTPTEVFLQPRYGLANTVASDWRRDVLDGANTARVSNQGVPIKHIQGTQWNFLNFRSQSEVRIAEALDDCKVLYLPNCMARLGIKKRVNREADFLICANSKWGILEVDGEPFHPPETTFDAQERDRIFLYHGVKCVHHFPAHECFENAPGVVKQFLALLDKA